MNRKTNQETRRPWLISCALVISLALAPCAAVADDEDEIAVDIGHLFLLNIEYAKWPMAFKKLSPRQQEKCGGSPNKMAEHVIAAFESRVTRWEHTSSERNDDWARASFSVEREGKPPLGVGVIVEEIDGQWLIQEMGVGNKDLCPS